MEPTVQELLPELFRQPGLLDAGDKQFLDGVHSEVVSGLRQRHMPEDRARQREVLDVVRRVGQHLRQWARGATGAEARTRMREFADGFPGWSRARAATCREVRGIGTALHKHKFNSDVARVVSNSVSLLGGVALGASAVATALTLGAAAPLLIVGAVVTGAGSAGAVGTSITESVLQKVNVDRANAVLREDAENSRCMEPWLVLAAELQGAVQDIRDIDLARDIVDAVMGVIQDASDLYHGQRKTQSVRTCAQAALAVIPTGYGQAVEAVALLVELLVLMVMLRRRNVLVCDCAALTVRIVAGVITLVDGAIDIGINLAGVVGRQVTRNVGAAVARGGLAAFSIALDISMIVMSSIDLHNGSRSEVGDKLVKVADLMELQRTEAERVYNDMEERMSRGG